MLRNQGVPKFLLIAGYAGEKNMEFPSFVVRSRTIRPGKPAGFEDETERGQPSGAEPKIEYGKIDRSRHRRESVEGVAGGSFGNIYPLE